MNLWESVALGTVEGLTEFLPVSSTGHLILASHALKIEQNEATQAFEVIIQAAAVLAVIWNYRATLGQLLTGVRRGQAEAYRRVWAIALAFLPAAVIGLLTHKKIKALLFGVTPVVAALVVGGLAMIFIERRLRRPSNVVRFGADRDPTPPQALKIGFFQCLALWPGTSRSMVTILGGRITGLDARKAAEFSFLLSIPTLLAAASLDLWKHGAEIGTLLGWDILAAGFVSSFVVSLLVIRAFLAFLRFYSLEAFGWYRVAAGLLIWILVK